MPLKRLAVHDFFALAVVHSITPLLARTPGEVEVEERRRV